MKCPAAVAAIFGSLMLVVVLFGVSSTDSFGASRPIPKPKLTPEQIWLNSSEARCVEMHESTDGKYSSNLWQFQGQTWYTTTKLSGSPGIYSVGVQDAAAYKLFLAHGWWPWLADSRVCGLGV